MIQNPMTLTNLFCSTFNRTAVIADSFSEGLAAVGKKRRNTKYGFIDKYGHLIIKERFDYTLGFSEGLTAVMKGKKWGFINIKGRLVIRDKFDNTFGFFDGLAAVKIGNKWGFINKDGKLVINNKYEFVWPFSNEIEDLASFATRSTNGFIDKSGKVICEFNTH